MGSRREVLGLLCDLVPRVISRVTMVILQAGLLKSVRHTKGQNESTGALVSDYLEGNGTGVSARTEEMGSSLNF